MSSSNSPTLATIADRADSAKLIPPAWRVLIEKAMSPAPQDRYDDARHFAQALRGVREEIARRPQAEVRKLRSTGHV